MVENGSNEEMDSMMAVEVREGVKTDEVERMDNRDIMSAPESEDRGMRKGKRRVVCKRRKGASNKGKK